MEPYNVKITSTTKNVHSKSIFESIDEHMRAVVMLFDLSIDMNSAINLIEMMLEDEAESNKLEQLNVVADSRNNKFSELKKNKFIIDIYYKHKNCFNTTHLSYTIQK